MENDAEHWRRLADKLDGPTKCVFAPEIAALRTAADTVDRLRKELAERNEYGYSQRTVDALTQERDRLQARIATLEAVEKAARELRDNAEEYDCEGLGLFAQHGYWHPLHDALDEIDDRATAALEEEP